MSEVTEPEAPSPPQRKARQAAPRWFRLLDTAKRLKRPIVAVAAVGAVLSGLLGYWSSYRAVHEAFAPAIATQASPADAGPLSIVVLPFVNQTGDPQRAYIADGLTSSVTADLSRIRDAFIVPVSTAVAYRDKAVPVKQIGRDLGVRFVLQGSVMADGNRLRIHAQLADAQSGAQKWTDIFEGDMSDLFALQDQVTARIGNSIGNQMVILAARESQTRKRSANVTDLQLRADALSLNPWSLQNEKRVEALSRQVLAADPANARATLGLAWSLLLQAYNAGPDLSDEARERLIAEGGALALKAKAIDPDNPDLYGALVIQSWFQGDPSAAVHYAERRLEIDARDPGAYNNLANLYLKLVQPAKSIALLKKALEVYPKGFDHIFGNMAFAHFMLGDNRAAVTWARKAIDIDTGHPEIYALLAIAYSEQGDNANALAAKSQALQRFPDLKAPVLSHRECVTQQWCHYLQTQYLPAWRRAGLP
jgi:adenylate cyclase